MKNTHPTFSPALRNKKVFPKIEELDEDQNEMSRTQGTGNGGVFKKIPELAYEFSVSEHSSEFDRSSSSKFGK